MLQRERHIHTCKHEMVVVPTQTTPTDALPGLFTLSHAAV